MSVVAVVLAAGFSRRLGRPKQSVVLAGETLLQRAVRVAHEAGLSPVFAVVRDDVLVPDDAVVVLNEEAGEGIAASIRAGVRAAQRSGASGVVLMTCDQVAITSAHLRELYAQPGVATGSGYAQKVAVPAYFPASCFDELLRLHGDTGARDLLREARAVPTEALAFDIDTEADVQAARDRMER